MLCVVHDFILSLLDNLITQQKTPNHVKYTHKIDGSLKEVRALVLDMCTGLLERQIR